jgi:ABC-2 type transport system ATP-binding protein
MLSIEDLSHVYPGDVRALDHVSLEIPPGMFGLLGPNGAGKSTLMRSVATLQTPTSGSIRFGDIDVIAEPEKLRRVLGYLPQDFGVYPRVSAYDLLDHMAVLKGISGRGERKETVEALLQQVNLWGVRKKAVAGYSGGMRQRFGIAQALIGRPQLIIVDEPTAGLDPEERNRFLNLLAEIGENSPAQLIAELKGRIWTKTIDKAELEAVRAAHQVISTRLFAGRTVVHVLADAKPGDGFTAVSGGLEDVYFSTLAAPRRAA